MDNNRRMDAMNVKQPLLTEPGKFRRAELPLGAVTRRPWEEPQQDAGG